MKELHLSTTAKTKHDLGEVGITFIQKENFNYSKENHTYERKKWFFNVVQFKNFEFVVFTIKSQFCLISNVRFQIWVLKPKIAIHIFKFDYVITFISNCWTLTSKIYFTRHIIRINSKYIHGKKC